MDDIKMSFLDIHWKAIQHSKESIPRSGSGGPFPSWNYDPINMSMIVCALKLAKPTMIIETGTFEGWGTVEMAKAISSYADNAVLWTIDAGAPVVSVDGDPVNLVLADWRQGEKYQRWGEVINRRNQNLSKTFSGCTVKYLKGIAWDILPDFLQKEGPWDFCFQDSSHHPTQVRKEWEAFKPYGHEGSIVVFDDIPDNDHGFLVWFKKNELDEWNMRYTEKGHMQLWAEKRM